MNKRILSVFYHAIVEDDEKETYFSKRNIRKSKFYDHMKWFKKNYNPISIHEFLKLQSGRKYFHKKNPVLISFDDGHESVFKIALPILEELQIPAIVFVLASVVDKPELIPWYVERDQILETSDKKAVELKGKLYNLENEKELRELFSLISNQFEAFGKKTDKQKREGILNEYAVALGVSRLLNIRQLDNKFKFIEIDDARSLTADCILSVGSHAYSHVNLECLNPVKQKWELKKSHEILSEVFENYVPVIAYPGGSHDITIQKMVSEIYKWGFAVKSSIRNSKASFRNRYAYPRIGLSGYRIKKLKYVISWRRNYLYWVIKTALRSLKVRT